MPSGELDFEKLHRMTYNEKNSTNGVYQRERAFLERLMKHKDTEKMMHNAFLMRKA